MKATEEYLGTIETVIVGAGSHGLHLEAGEPLILERNPHNQRDRNTVSVSYCGEPMGFLPRRIVHWLAPLMDYGRVRAEAVVAPTRRVRHGLRPITLQLGTTETSHALFELTANANSPGRLIHTLVLQAYEAVVDWEDPGATRELTTLLQRLSLRDLLPETEMLLALLPSRTQAVERRKSTALLDGIRAKLRGVRIGGAMHHHNLTLFPLFVMDGHTPQYLLLVDALESGQAEVTEISEGGSVPELKVVNRAGLPLLIPEGEILAGAKQNRVVNTTVLVGAHSEFVLPVICVEQGRWNHVSQNFRASDYAPMGLRAMKTADVRRNRAASGRYASDQGAVWNDVACRLREFECDSPTESLSDGFQTARVRTQSYREKLFPPEECAGFVVATAGRGIGMDLFDSPLTLHRLWPRLSESYFMEAARAADSCAVTEDAVATTLIESVVAGMEMVDPPLGIGTEFEVRSKQIVAAGVYYQERILHLAAFAT